MVEVTLYTSGLNMVEVGWHYDTLQFPHFEMLVDLSQAADIASFTPGLGGVSVILSVLEPHQIQQQSLGRLVDLIRHNVRAVPGHKSYINRVW